MSLDPFVSIVSVLFIFSEVFSTSADVSISSVDIEFVNVFLVMLNFFKLFTLFKLRLCAAEFVANTALESNAAIDNPALEFCATSSAVNALEYTAAVYTFPAKVGVATLAPAGFPPIAITVELAGVPIVSLIDTAVPVSVPFKYNLTLEPSYVSATWYTVPGVMVCVEVTFL